MTHIPYSTVSSKEIKLVIPVCDTVALEAVESLSAMYECALSVACHALSESTIFDVSQLFLCSVLAYCEDGLVCCGG